MCCQWRRDVVKKWDVIRACPGLHTAMYSRGDSWMWRLRSALMIQLINQPLGLFWSTSGDLAGKKRCHSDLTNNISHSTNRSDFSQLWCYTVMRSKVLIRFLQHELMNTKDCCFLPAGFAQKGGKILEQHDFSQCLQWRKSQLSFQKLLTGAYKCQHFISWDVSSLFCYWNVKNYSSS